MLVYKVNSSINSSWKWHLSAGIWYYRSHGGGILSDHSACHTCVSCREGPQPSLLCLSLTYFTPLTVDTTPLMPDQSQKSDPEKIRSVVKKRCEREGEKIWNKKMEFETEESNVWTWKHNIYNWKTKTSNIKIFINVLFPKLIKIILKTTYSISLFYLTLSWWIVQHPTADKRTLWYRTTTPPSTSTPGAREKSFHVVTQSHFHVPCGLILM